MFWQCLVWVTQLSLSPLCPSVNQFHGITVALATNPRSAWKFLCEVGEGIYLPLKTDKQTPQTPATGRLFVFIIFTTFPDFDLQQLSVPAHRMRQAAAVQRKKGEQILWHNTLCCTELQLHLQPCTWSDKSHGGTATSTFCAATLAGSCFKWA